MYDMDAMYLYYNGYRYEVGNIEKVNEKTIRMTSNTKINKEDFETKTYKLTEEEVNNYRGELIKKLSNSQHKVREMISDLNRLRGSLLNSHLVQIDVEKLQSAIDDLEEILKRELPQPVNINNKVYKFKEIGISLEEENKCTI